jgi:glycerol-3-phosphate acyltransferase PlsY
MTILYALLSYLFGAIPTGFILFWLSEKKDIRNYGSQAIGATNVLRTKGWKMAVPVALFDVAKGAIPVIVALQLFSDRKFALLCGFLAVLGHCFPIFIKFRGGKGVATALGVYLTAAPIPALLCVGVFLVVVLLTKFVSLGSLLAMASYPLLVYLMSGDIPVVVMSGAVFALIMLKHRGNLRRIFQGNERKLGEKIG